MGTFIRRLPCEACGSSDAGALYGDGSTYCFACGDYQHGDEEKMGKREEFVKDGRKVRANNALLSGSFVDIPNRNLKEETCRKYDYRINQEEACHVAGYHSESGELVAQKVRRAGKQFSVVGSLNKATPLYGQHLFNPGKSVVITEGEIDCLAVAQAFNLKWPVVSLPHGAKGALRACETAYEWLEKFDKVVLCFDMDEPGAKATAEVAALLPPGKAHVMKLPLKDAGETLVRMGSSAIVDAFWRAAPWRPEGIVSGVDITRETLKATVAKGYSSPYPKLNEMLGDIRKRELLLLTAGTGIGKSTLAREIAYHLHQKEGLTIGNVFLEESKEKTAQGYIAIDNNVPLGKLRRATDILTDEQWDSSLERVIHQRMHFYDHFGSLESSLLLAKLRYMAVVLKCDFIFLDHISIVISGQASSSEGERRDIDVLMTNLRMLIESTGVGIIGIVHLKQPEGKSHEEGGRVTLSHLRGSGSLKQLPDAIVALERNQQDAEGSDTTQVRILKNREFGETGVADELEYSRETGRLLVSAASKFGTEEL